jgi:hypothetical protein
MNPDVPRIEAQARKHWAKYGYSEGRLYHPEQLVVTAEFGFELLVYACYFYWLHRRGLLFQHTITTYPGMRSFYWFLPDRRVKEVARQRTGHSRPSLFLHNPQEHVKDFDYRYWEALPLRRHYSRVARQLLLPPSDKPLLIIHNKYNSEWGGAPVNYIPPDQLRELVAVLAPTYQLVYIRPVGTESGFSWDHNRLVASFPDYEVLPAHVWQLNELHQQCAPHLTYNEFKIRVYCRATCFIGTQGGSSHFAAFFGGRQLILHVRGSESRSGAYEGWYHRLCSNPALELTVTKRASKLPLLAQQIFLQPATKKPYTRRL